MRKVNIISILVFLFVPFLLSGQTDAGVKIIPKQGDLYENAKNLNNPYKLPIGSKKLGAKGFLLPYPIGVMLNGYMGDQDVTISDLSIGINNASGGAIIPQASLDNIVDFSEVTASVRNFNMRSDIWVLPFLDVYGIFGKAWVETQVGIGSIAGQPVNIHTKANFDGYVYGFGTMLTGGVRSIFFSLDFNKVWTHFDEMENDNSAINLAPRVGYIFHIEGKPERNISLWTGAGRVFLNNETKGTVSLAEVAPNFGENYKTQDWYVNLEENHPQEAKIVDQVVENFIDKNKGDVVNYSLSKKPSHNWCMILGAQYQLSRHWQFRVESNFLGGRKSGLISANYRFGVW